MNEKQKTVRKKKKQRNSVLRVAGMTVLILLFVLAIAFVVADIFDRKNPDASGGGNDEWFYTVSSDNVSAMAPFDKGGLAVLTDTSVKYFDSYGNSVGSNEFTYSSPVLETCGKNVLLYDRGGYSLRVEKNGVTFSNQTFDSVVTLGAIGKKGNYAYVLDANEGFQSHLYVYNFRGAKQFEWGCSSDYISDIALSDNGRNLCAAVMGADNAEYFSDIILFSFRSDEPVYTLRLADTAVYAVSFIGYKKIAAYSDKGVFIVDGDGEYKILQNYSPLEMEKSSAESKYTGSTVINRYGDEKNVLLTVFSKKYKNTFEKEYSDSVKALYSSPDHTAVAFADRVEVLNSENSVTGQLDLDDTCIDCVISGRNVFVLHAGGIKRYSVASGG